MLRFCRLMLNNFGPFKGEQYIYFPREPGVSIIYGENMRGKTSLLNAIRYALYGKVLGRGSYPISLHRVGNWESAKAGHYGFKVVLELEYGGSQYELTRMHRPRDGVEYPESDYDYVEESFLCRNGNVLSPEEKDIELQRIMPEQVSRFFLFDGELLQQYEELLRDESEMGLNITDSIERILGVPVLMNSRADLRELHKLAQKQASKAAQNDQRTRELGSHLEDLTEKYQHYEDELERLEEDLKKLKSEKTRLEDTLKKSERMESLFNEKRALENEINDLDNKREEQEEKLKGVMSNVWRSVLVEKISEKRQLLNDEINIIQKQLTEKQVLKKNIEIIKEAISAGECPTCEQKLDAKAIESLKEKSNINTVDDGKDNDYLQKLLRLVDNLKMFEKVENNIKLVSELKNSIDNIKIDKSTKEDRIEEIKEAIGDFDNSDIRTEYDNTVKEITIVGQNIKKVKDEMKKIDGTIEELQKKLDKAGGSDITKEQRKRELCNKLVNLFDDSVKIYREDLRSKVEKDATELFHMLTTEPEYEKLEINESYGLSIIHKDGQTISVRSAGAEHIVAIALIGALQKNAPLQGPIIMDSPFGRLDDQHTINVIRALPRMAEQVMLFVYESELNPKVARNELLGKLKSEYKMVRQTARHTTLEKGV